MFTKIKEYSGVVAVILLLVGFFIPSASTPVKNFGTATASYYDAAQGFRVSGTEVISSAGVIDGTVSTTAITANSITIGGGTAVTGRKCATSTWNPAATASTTAAVLDVTDTGYALGDIISGTIATSTQGLAVIATPSTTNVISLSLFDPDNTGAAIDIATTTATVCYTH